MQNTLRIEIINALIVLLSNDCTVTVWLHCNRMAVLIRNCCTVHLTNFPKSASHLGGGGGFFLLIRQQQSAVRKRRAMIGY